MKRRLPFLVPAAAILAAAAALAGSAWYGRAAAREARLETVRVRAREAVGDVVRRFEGRLDELVARESERPFYLYQHLYNPPDALAAQFVLQTSPLAVPSDPLVSTWFEILPDGRLSLPQDPPAGQGDAAARRSVANEVLPELIARVHRAPDREPLVNVATNLLEAPAATAPAVAPPTPTEEPPPPVPQRPRPNRDPPNSGRPAPPADPPASGDPRGANGDPDPAAAAPDPPLEDPGADEQQPSRQQVTPLPRWTVETNTRANDIANTIDLANQGDPYAQQQLQADFNMMRGLPPPQQQQASPPQRQQASPQHQPSSPPQAQVAVLSAPDAGGSPPPDGGTAATPDAGPPSPPDAGTQDVVDPDTGRRDARRPPRIRRDAGPSPPVAAVLPDAGVDVGAGPPDAPEEAGVAATGPLDPQLAVVTADPTLQPATDQVPVIYGAFEPLRTPDGVTYYVRTVDIEGDVRVQGFRLSPGGLRATLNNELLDVQRGHDPFRLTWEPAASGALASRAVDGVPGVAAISALLVPDSPTLAAEDEEDRRVVLTLAGLSFAIAAAVIFAFLAMRREMELARRKSDFLSAVSHELRAPVTTIRMYAEMLRDGWVDDATRRGEYESAIVSEGERLSRLVENVLAYSRRERGKPLDLRDGDLAEKVREVVGLERPLFQQAGLELEVEAPETLPWRFDPDAVTQILVNLLDNALKHSRDAEDRRVTVRLRAAPDEARLEVQDHGGGIPAPEQRRIFEAFYRVGNELTRETRGAGLGLALVRRLAQGHRGDVTVRSEPGQGATFIVRLGRVPPARTP
jgi:signal transduction histidine kinase